jgi:ABC-type nitrate/sulfonate/bicarbonate transport system ATPase subunit
VSSISIHIENYSYAKSRILEDVSFEIESGNVTVLMGPSGCGKSTLLRILMGFDSGASGHVGWDGQKTSFLDWTSNQRLFSLVPQVPHLFPWKTVFENVFLATDPTLSKAERHKLAFEILERVGLGASGQSFPFEISVGMASRVSFARALVMQQKCLLLDEPFAALDAVTRNRLQIWFLQKVREQGLSALFVTHDVREAMNLGNKIIVLGTNPARIRGVFESKKQVREASDENFHWENERELEQHILALLDDKIFQ